MIGRAAAAFLLLTCAGAVHAQDAEQPVSSGSSGNGTVAGLVSSGYEIRGASQVGTKTIVFLQKGTSAYACEFATLSSSRCGLIK